MRSHFSFKLAPLDHHTDPEQILARLAEKDIRLVKKKYAAGRNFQYKCVGLLDGALNLGTFTSQFLVDVKGNTYFLPDILAHKNSLNYGLLPDTELLTKDDTKGVTFENFEEHADKLVHNEVYADMLLSARFLDRQTDKLGEKQEDVSNLLSEITRPKKHNNPQPIIFPCGFQRYKIFERMKENVELPNKAAEGLIHRYFAEKFTYASDLADSLSAQHDAMLALQRKHGRTEFEEVQLKQFITDYGNFMALEKQRKNLISDLTALRHQLEADVRKFDQLLPRWQLAIAKHPIQQATAYNRIFSKSSNANAVLANFKNNRMSVPFLFMTGIFIPVAILLIVENETAKRHAPSYQILSDFRELANRNGALLPDRTITTDPGTLGLVEKWKKKKFKHYYQMQDISEEFLLDPQEIKDNIEARMLELQFYIDQVTALKPAYANEQQVGAGLSTSSTSSTTSIQQANAIAPYQQQRQRDEEEKNNTIPPSKSM